MSLLRTIAIRTHRAARVKLVTAATAAIASAVLLVPFASRAQESPVPGARAVRYLERVVALGSARFQIHAAYVDLCDASVELRTTAPDERGQTVSAWARSVGAVVATNGDYFDAGTMSPLGPARGQSRWWPGGRRMHRDALFAFSAGRAPVLLDAPRQAGPVTWSDAPERIDAGFSGVLAVRERVLVGGQTQVSPSIRHDGGRHPRTALGLSANRQTLIVLVIDGRSEASSGATVPELAQVLRTLGAWDGMKLDGGGSSTLFVSGRGVVSHPSDGRERVVANHFGVLVHEPGVRRSWAWCDQR